MYCSHLLALKELLNDNQIRELELYFSGLIGNAVNNITVSKVAKAINISPVLASRVLTKCKENGLLDVFYSIRCPKCHTLIKKVKSLAEVPAESFECYSCDEEIEVEPCDIEIVYGIIDNGVFIDGQQEDYDGSVRTVVPEDSMENIFLAGDVNQYFFHPTDEEYAELSRRYTLVMTPSSTTKDTGDTLENLTQYLFNLCKVFRAAGIRTATNQIDCFVRNKMFLRFGVMNSIGQRVFIECKNESKTPSGGYMSKLHSIILITNASGKGDCIKLGIIVSKERGPSTFKEIAVKSYLSDGIVMINICGEEIKHLIDSKGNLLEMIERKITEIKTDATTDMVAAGLYDG